MANTLNDVITNIQTRLNAVNGIRKAPNEPPENINVYPFVVTFPGSGTLSLLDAARTKELHNVIVQVHVQRTDLPRDYKAAMTAYGLVRPILLADPTFGSNAHTFESIYYTFGELNWAGQITLGWAFEITNIKIEP